MQLLAADYSRITARLVYSPTQSVSLSLLTASADYLYLHFQVELVQLLVVGCYRVTARLVCYPTEFAALSVLTASTSLLYLGLLFEQIQYSTYY